MSIDTQAIIKEYQKDTSDTGSADVQVALLTARIKHLTEHFKTHIKKITTLEEDFFAWYLSVKNYFLMLRIMILPLMQI